MILGISFELKDDLHFGWPDDENDYIDNYGHFKIEK